jgi:hypothetical protein
MQDVLARMLVRPEPIDGEPEVATLAESIAAGSPRLSPASQVEVYREQFWLRHVGSLREDYATLVHLLGDEDFEVLVRGYLAAHPPKGFRLRDLGAALPGYVAHTLPWSADALLADCARLEWALIEAFDAADVPPLDPARIAGLGEDDWPRAVLVLEPSVRILSARHPVDTFRTAVRTGQAPERPAEGPVELVAHRRNETLYVERVTLPARVLLQGLAAGMPLGLACERAAQEALAEEIEAALPAWFQRWTALGWIADVRVD